MPTLWGMARRLPILSVLVALSLAACAAPTPYAPAETRQGGYSERLVEPGRYRVKFSGNSLTSRDTVESYALHRAAELTLEHGGEHFIVTQRNVDIDTTYVADFPPVPYYRPYYRRHFYPGDPFGPFPYAYGPTRLDTIRRFSATVEFVVGEGPKPDDPEAFDAQAVIDTLGPEVRRPEDTRS